MMETKAIAFIAGTAFLLAMSIVSAVWTGFLYKAYTADTLTVNNLIVQRQTTFNARKELDLNAYSVTGSILRANYSSYPVVIQQITTASANATSLTLANISNISTITASAIHVKQKIIQQGNIPQLSTYTPFSVDSLMVTSANFDTIKYEVNNITTDALQAGTVITSTAQTQQLKVYQAIFTDVGVSETATTYLDFKATGTTTTPHLSVENAEVYFFQQASTEINIGLSANTDVNITFEETGRFRSLLVYKDATFYNNSYIQELTVKNELSLNTTTLTNIKISQLVVDNLEATSIKYINDTYALTVSNMTTDTANAPEITTAHGGFSFPESGSATLKGLNVSGKLIFSDYTLTIQQNTTISSNAMAPFEIPSIITAYGTIEFENLTAKSLQSYNYTVLGALTTNKTTGESVTTTTANLSALGTVTATGSVSAQRFGNDDQSFIALKNNEPWVQANEVYAGSIVACEMVISSQGTCAWN